MVNKDFKNPPRTKPLTKNLPKTKKKVTPIKRNDYLKKRRIDKDKEEKEARAHSRFMAMSKIIGVVVCIFAVVTVLYSLIEMHLQQDLSSLPQLIISMFAVVGIYIGFYLTMAKVEHVEQEITFRQEKLKEYGVSNEEVIEAYKQQTDQLNEVLTQLITREDNTNI